MLMIIEWFVSMHYVIFMILGNLFYVLLKSMSWNQDLVHVSMVLKAEKHRTHTHLRL